MCEEFCLICEQCDSFKNGCLGQTGTFFNSMCPSVIIEDVEQFFVTQEL